MQLRCLLTSFVLVVLSSTPALCGDYSAVEVGTTGKYLRNSALHQEKHYLENDDDLMARVCAVIEDMDVLLASLHALPPELAGSTVIDRPLHSELIDLIKLGLENSPELQPYRSQLGVLAAQTRQAGAMKDPMLMFQLMNFPSPQFPIDDEPMTQIALGVSQDFESYGKRKIRRSISRMEEELTEYSLAQQELDLVGQITDEYFQIAGLMASRRVLEENIGLLKLLVELAERKYALGILPQAEVLNAQLSLTELDQRLLEVDSAIARHKEMLFGILGRPEESLVDGFNFSLAYPLPQLLDIDTAEITKSAFDLRPDYQRMLAMYEQQGLMLELSKRGYRPDYSLSLSYGMRWGMRNVVSAGVSFPLFTHKEEKQDAAVQEKAAMLDMTQAQIGVLENNLATRIEVLLIDSQRLYDISNLYREGLVPQARLALDSSIASFAANLLDLSDLVKAQQQLLSLELELEQQYIDYLALLSELQVITAGAFDPSPYLDPLLEHEDPGSPSAGLISPVAAQPDETVSVDQDGFISSLDLPERESSAEEISIEDEPAGNGTGGPAENGFFQPFKPKDKEDDG